MICFISRPRYRSEVTACGWHSAKLFDSQQPKPFRCKLTESHVS